MSIVTSYITPQLHLRRRLTPLILSLTLFDLILRYDPQSQIIRTKRLKYTIEHCCQCIRLPTDRIKCWFKSCREGTRRDRRKFVYQWPAVHRCCQICKFAFKAALLFSVYWNSLTSIGHLVGWKDVNSIYAIILVEQLFLNVFDGNSLNWIVSTKIKTFETVWKTWRHHI